MALAPRQGGRAAMMQVHGPDTTVHGIDVTRYHQGAVVLRLGGLRIVTYSEADCDELIKAAVAAKDIHIADAAEAEAAALAASQPEDTPVDYWPSLYGPARHEGTCICVTCTAARAEGSIA